jgi:hypothetical protein
VADRLPSATTSRRPTCRVPGDPSQRRERSPLHEHEHMPYEMRDNRVQEGPNDAASADEVPAPDPGKIYDDAISRLESITQEWAEVVRSVNRG